MRFIARPVTRQRVIGTSYQAESIGARYRPVDKPLISKIYLRAYTLNRPVLSVTGALADNSNVATHALHVVFDRNSFVGAMEPG